MNRPNQLQLVSLLFVIASTSCLPLAAECREKINQINLSINDGDALRLKASKKTVVEEADIEVLEDARTSLQSTVKLNSRGQSSLRYARKNYQIKMASEQSSGNENLTVGDVESKTIVLSAGAEDPLLLKNMLVYRLFETAGLPIFPTDYAEVSINGKSQGLYMVSPNPGDYLVKKTDADVAFHRGYDDSLELKASKKTLSEADIESYREALEAIFADLKNLKREKLLASLQRRMNFDQYLRILAVNALVKNGDFADEIYFAGTKAGDGQIYFNVLPWDLDNTFADRMHLSNIPLWANNGQKSRAEKQMLYSFESRMDRAISKDRVLLSRYFKILGEVSAELSDKKLDALFTTVSSKLKPYLADRNNLRSGRVDQAKRLYEPQILMSDLKTKRSEMKLRVAMFRRELAVIEKESSSRARGFSPIRLFFGKLEQKLALKYLRSKGL